MSADDDRFDPRFDPAFQRGYSGSTASGAPSGTPSGTAAASARPQVEKPAPYRVSEREQPARPIVHEDREEPDESLDEMPARRTNPFLIALGAVALVLVGGGLYLISRLRDLFASTQNQTSFDFVTMTVLMDLAPLIVSVGLVTAIGVLFIFAVRWGRPAGPPRSRR